MKKIMLASLSVLLFSFSAQAAEFPAECNQAMDKINELYAELHHNTNFLMGTKEPNIDAIKDELKNGLQDMQHDLEKLKTEWNDLNTEEQAKNQADCTHAIHRLEMLQYIGNQ